MEPHSRSSIAETVLSPPYAGIRVLDMTHALGAYAGRLFADFGAEVVRVEPPGGLADRRLVADGIPGARARFLFLNAGKRSVEIDLDDEDRRIALSRLAGGAQIILVERDGPFYDRIGELQAMAAGAVITAISPFGMTGPLADAPASDLTLQAAGGIAWMSGRIEDAPLSLPFDQATMVASVYAATVTAIALVDSETTGAGHLIDVSAQECIAHSLQNAIQVWDLEQRISIRGGIGTRDATEDIFPCADGFVFLAAPLALGASFRALVGYMKDNEHPSGERLSEPRWQDREWRLTREARDAFRAIFTDFVVDIDRETLTREAIARRIVLGPVSRVSDIFDDPQLAYREFFTQMRVDGDGYIRFPGAPYRTTPQVWRAGVAPRLGEHGKTIAGVAP
ncbi:CoA transferase [Aquibium sp. LZ166]|uniref:CoA transferase n=1 Tax=Aquibium pacificus TaxID=3153579 RepID=A0ABV3SKQ6_9HYPH